MISGKINVILKYIKNFAAHSCFALMTFLVRCINYCAEIKSACRL